MKIFSSIAFTIILVVVVSSPTALAQNHRHQPSATTETSLSYRVPDAIVYDQNGKRLKFYSDLIKGRTVAINFIFTTCTTICPPLTATFRRVQQELGERGGANVNLISVTVDPTIDTPEQLKLYADKFKAGAGWTFITGGKGEIDRILTALGAAVSNKNDHTPTVVIGNDAARYWTRVYGLSRPAMLADSLIEASKRSQSSH